MSFKESFASLFHKKKFHPRSQRIRFAEEEKIFFSLSNPAARFPVENLSESGLGLCVLKEIPELPVCLNGTLSLDKQEIPLSAEIVRESSHYLGCRILKGNKEVRQLLNAYFQTEFFATQMKEVQIGSLRGEGAGRPRWFYAPHDYELYVLEKEKNIVKLQLSFGEHVVLGKLGERLRYGTISESETEIEAGKEPETKKIFSISWKPLVSEEARILAIRIIENINPLSPRDRNQLKLILRA